MSTPSATPDQPTPRQPWDQLPDEPAAAYARFLTYRNLGPSRTLEQARDAHAGEEPEGTESHQASGQWKRQCAEFRWVERCEAYDVAVLQEAGTRAVALYVAMIAEAAARALRALVEGDLRPTKGSEVLETLQSLGQLIPAETLAAVAEQRAQGG